MTREIKPEVHWHHLSPSKLFSQSYTSSKLHELGNKNHSNLATFNRTTKSITYIFKFIHDLKYIKNPLKSEAQSNYYYYDRQRARLGSKVMIV